MSTVTPVNTTNGASAPVQPTPSKQMSTIEGTAKVTEVATENKADELTPKFAALARKEKQLRAQQQAVKAKEAELERTLQAKQSEYEQSWKSRLASSPLEVLNESGLSYDQLTQLMLNQPGPESQKIASLEREIAALKAGQENIVKQGQDANTQQREQAKIQIGREISNMIKGNESFEAMGVYGEEAVQAAVEFIEKNFDVTGDIMDYEKACQAVEDYYIEEGMKVAALKKIQSKLTPPPVEAPEAKKLQNNKQPQITTLSNRMSLVETKPMNSRERRERAMRAFRGEIK